ncbi:MAG: HAMP domain-containing sensor histidine kinase, partial [Ferrovibrio sp.]
SGVLAITYHTIAQRDFEQSKKIEKEALLRLADGFVQAYSSLTSNPAVPPATLTHVALKKYLETNTDRDQTRINWVGIPGLEIATPPVDDQLGRRLQSMARSGNQETEIRIVKTKDGTILRSIHPSIASQQDCVSCHNQIVAARGQSPHWKLGDMMGAFVLEVTIDDFLHGLGRKSAMFGIAFFLISTGIGFVFFRQNFIRVKVETENRLFVEIGEAIEAIGDGLAVYSAGGHQLVANKAYRRRHSTDHDTTFSEPVLKTSWEERNGEHRWVKVDEAKTHSGLVVYLETDITTLKEREEDLVAAKMTAEAAGKARSDFLALMSHELRTPLNAIIGFSELTMNRMFGPIQAKYHEYACDIHRSGTHLLDLINDILDMSKIDAGKMTLNLEVLSLTDAISQCYRLVESQAAERDIKVNCDFKDEMLVADPLRFRQIIVNLLTNAVKFTPRGGVINIGALRLGESLKIWVSDTGIGIASEDVPKILEPFVQVGDMKTRGNGGSGLGLPITKALIEMHGGTMAINSRKGAGTVVTIMLPQRQMARTAIAN